MLHVVGEGGDPHGFSALVSIVCSALAVAGFRLETVFDWVGKIDENGEITAEAEVRSIEDFFAAADSASAPEQSAEGDGAAIIEFPQTEEASSSSEENSPEPGASRGPRGGARTRLSLDDAGGAKTSHAKSTPHQGGGKKPAGANGKPKGSHAGGGSQGKRGGRPGGARAKGAAKKGNSKKGNGRG